MRVSDTLFTQLCEAFNRIDLVALPEVRHAVEAALSDAVEPSDEDAIGKRVWPLQAILAEAHMWRLRNDDVEFPDLDDLEEILLRDTTGAPSPAKRIAELEAQLASVGKDMPEMLAPCERKDDRIAELEANFALMRARRSDLLALAVEWNTAANALKCGDRARYAQRDCADEMRTIVERIPDGAGTVDGDQETLSRSSFSAHRVVSKPGAAIKVTALELTPAAQEALSTGGARIPASGTLLDQFEKLAAGWECDAARWREHHADVEHGDSAECEEACNAEAKQVERLANELRVCAKAWLR